MKQCTCKQIIKTSKQKLLPRMPKGTYKTPIRLGVTIGGYKDKRTTEERAPYHRKYYRLHAPKLRKYERKWWKKYGKQYHIDTKEHRRIINCLWLVRTGRLK